VVRRTRASRNTSQPLS